MSLRRAGLQHLSFPYDRIGPRENTDEYDADVRHRAENIADEFRGRWLVPEELLARQKEYEKFGVRNWWQLRLAKWRMHLKRHFEKTRISSVG